MESHWKGPPELRMHLDNGEKYVTMEGNRSSERTFLISVWVPNEASYDLVRSELQRVFDEEVHMAEVADRLKVMGLTAMVTNGEYQCDLFTMRTLILDEGWS